MSPAGGALDSLDEVNGCWKDMALMTDRRQS